MVFKKESFGLDAPTPKLWDVAELSYDSDENDDELDPLHPEDWQDWYSEELLYSWEKIREYLDSKYIRTKTTFPKFIEFVMYPHVYFDTLKPTQTEHDLWIAVSRVKFFSDRVNDVQFFTWIRKNIDCNSNV